MSFAIDSAPDIAASDMQFVIQFILKECGIVLDYTKGYLVCTRLSEVARRENCATVATLIQRLRFSPTLALKRSVVDAMTTNETTFFRDQSPFEAMKSDIIPDYVSAKKGAAPLRVWSAACSTGQEAYSIAMLIHEHFPEIARSRLEIVGTDISTSVLDRARAGKFSKLEINRGLPAKYLVKYFQQAGTDWSIKEEYRHGINFLHFNLLGDLRVLGTFDVIFCRNVLIYFDNDVKRRILTQMKSMLPKGCCLFLGGAETVLNVVQGYTRVQSGKAVYYRSE